MLDLQQISDRIEIDDLLARDARAIDTGEWDRLDEVFTADAYIDYTATGGIAGPYSDVKKWLADTLPMVPRRQHIIAQKEVYVVGDAAALTAYFFNPMVFHKENGTEELWEFAGLYRHKLVRTRAGWRSRYLAEELAWQRGL